MKCDMCSTEMNVFGENWHCPRGCGWKPVKAQGAIGALGDAMDNAHVMQAGAGTPIEDHSQLLAEKMKKEFDLNAGKHLCLLALTLSHMLALVTAIKIALMDPIMALEGNKEARMELDAMGRGLIGRMPAESATKKFATLVWEEGSGT